MGIFFNILASTRNRTSIINPIPPATGFELVSLIEDRSYSWWVKPGSIYHNGYNYFTSCALDGITYIHRYNPITDVVDSVPINSIKPGDEHNRPSFLCLENNIFVVSHTRNSTNMYWRTVGYEFTAESRSNNVNFGAAAGLDGANYSQLFKVGNRIYVFFRENDNQWSCTYTDNFGGSWVPKIVMFDNELTQVEKLYMIGQQNGDKVVFAMYYHPNSYDANKLMVTEIDLVTGDITEAGVVKGNFLSPTFTSVKTSTLNTLYSPSTGRKMRLFDVSLSDNGTRVNVLFANFNMTNDDCIYAFRQFNRSTLAQTVGTDIVEGGEDDYTSYYGGMYFFQSPQGAWNGDITVARTAVVNSVNMCFAERWSFNGSVFTNVEEYDSIPRGTSAPYDSLKRPEPVINYEAGGLKLIYQKGQNTNESLWDNVIMGVKPVV